MVDRPPSASCPKSDVPVGLPDTTIVNTIPDASRDAFGATVAEAPRNAIGVFSAAFRWAVGAGAIPPLPVPFITGRDRSNHE
ncbi:hypothetical protein [Streptomyces calidiresistens]|uniref:hypothetical protein n=1 Tax=Streptomyces calidiresistens TaxID=1485586 RepID=UPI002B1EAC29|nr:hypothetical protein [Streptomyces calidiresistens]